MDNALENENLNQGEINDNVGQDEEKQVEESTDDWKSQAKYFQSEKDKLYTENQNLKKYESVGKMLESRPDIVDTISGMVKGQPTQPQRIALEKDEFDPWEAYNNPESKSYKFRQQELQESINDAVSNQVGQVQKQVGMNQLTGELEKRGLNNEQIQSFYKFAKTNPSEYGIDGAINMWQSVTQNPTEGNENSQNPQPQIRQNKTVPQQVGILNGEKPIKTNEKDDMWKTIMNSGSRANVL
jgi:hypothetical protein